MYDLCMCNQSDVLMTGQRVIKQLPAPHLHLINNFDILLHSPMALHILLHTRSMVWFLKLSCVCVQ